MHSQPFEKQQRLPDPLDANHSHDSTKLRIRTKHPQRSPAPHIFRSDLIAITTTPARHTPPLQNFQNQPLPSLHPNGLGAVMAAVGSESPTGVPTCEQRLLVLCPTGVPTCGGGGAPALICANYGRAKYGGGLSTKTGTDNDEGPAPHPRVICNTQSRPPGGKLTG